VLAPWLLATLGVRLWTLRSMDMGGDAAFKWFFIRSWRADNPWVYDHHTARFAVNIPAWVFQQLLGSHPNVMYAAPLFFSLLQIPWLYAIGLRLGSVAAAVIASIGLLLFESNLIASSQLLPGIFQATYLLAALHALIVFAGEPSRGRWLLFAGGCLFAAYLSLVTTVYFLPGVALGVWGVRRKLLDVLRVCGVFVGLVLLETCAYALWSPFRYGQFQIIARTHTNVEPTTFFGLFSRFAELPLEWHIAIGLWLASCAALLQLRSPAARLPFCLVASGLFGMAFGIKHLDPLVPALNFRTRYFDPLMPPIALCIGLALGVAVQRVGRRFASRSRVSKLPAWPIAAGAYAVACALALVCYRLPEPALLTQHRQWQLLNAAYAQDLPIVGVNRSEHSQRKTLRCVQWAFLRDDLLLDQGALKLTKLGKSQARGHHYYFLARSAQAADAVSQAIKRRACFLGVARRETEPRLDVKVHAGPQCEGLRGDAVSVRP